MDEPENGVSATLYKGGCSCLGMAGCLGIVLLLLALSLAGGTLVLFTAPPLEYMSQVNNFLENYLDVTLILAVVLSLIVGGAGGYLGGTLLVRRRTNQAE